MLMLTLNMMLMMMLLVPILEYFSQLLVEPTHEAIDLIVNQTHVSLQRGWLGLEPGGGVAGVV